jgi:AmpE protein
VKFIALLVAFGVERLMSAQLHVREPGWLLAYVRAALRLVGRESGAIQRVLAIVFALLPGVAVAILGTGATVFEQWVHDVLSIALAAAVLFFSFGPRDLRQEVTEYRAAAGRGDAVAADRLAAEILEHDACQRRGAALESVAEAVFVQANNRLFGVLFWFAILGPLGALTFRVTDLMRREAILRAERADAPAIAAEVSELCQGVHGVIAFLPARMLALTYGVAGSFQESYSGWRSYVATGSDLFFDANDQLLVHAGRGALGSGWEHAPDEAERARIALKLVEAAFYVWVAGFAVLTLVAWIA